MRKWIVLALAAFAGSAARAEDITLFNGKDLSGWGGDVGVRGDEKAKVEEIWTVNDGLLHCSGGSKPWSWLHTQKDYTSFKLHVEWRWDEPDPEIKKANRNIYNSGVFVRAVPWAAATPQFPMPATFELQILPPSESTGDIWLMGENNPNFESPRLAKGETKAKRFLKAKFAEKPLGEWNAYDITFDRDRLTVKLNGEVVNEGQGAAILAGKIGLECENTPIDFRNIRLTPLKGQRLP